MSIFDDRLAVVLIGAVLIAGAIFTGLNIYKCIQGAGI